MDEEISGKEYALLICRYIARHYANRGIKLYREVSLGKSIIGKDRRVDILVLHQQTNRALAIECKYQHGHGTADEKIPYTIDDLRAMRMPACVVYAGEGFSKGVLHMLRACNMAAYCLPDESNPKNSNTKELDHVLAMAFGWWDIVVDDEREFVLDTGTGDELANFALQPVIAPKRRGPKPARRIIADEALVKKSGDGQ